MRPIYCRVLLVALLVVPTLSVDASAQAPTTGATAVGCTYATCALRIESSLFGQRLVRGATGERVGSIGAFGLNVDVLLGGADSAVAHAQAYVWNSKRSAILGSAGAIALGVVALRTRGSQSHHATNGDVVAAVAGAAVLAISVPFELRARRELARAIWWYNGALPR